MPSQNDADGEEAFVLAVGPLAPPIHGQAATTEGMLDYFRLNVPLYIVNNSPGTKNRIRGGWQGHSTKALRTLWGMWQMALQAPRHKKRVLYLSADGAYGILYNIAAATVARLFGYKIYLHHHSFAYVDNHNRLMACLSRVMGPHGTHIVLCDVQAAGLRVRYPFLANSPMLEQASSAFVEVTPRAALRQGTGLRIGFLSNLIVEKGLDTCIDLLRAARREDLPVRLVLAGRCPDERSKQIVANALAEFGDDIEYQGPLSEAQKTAFFLDLDVFAFPTRYINEAQPRAILESLCFGIPVLTIARSCITSDVGEGAGLCVPRDADFVAAVLPQVRQWCSDRGTLAASSQRAASRAHELRDAGMRDLQAIVADFRKP